MARGKLTAKQQRFVAEYLVDLNSTQAAIRAKYSAKTADRIGPELLGKTCVAVAIQAAMQAREERTQITQDEVLRQYRNFSFSDVRKLFNPDGSLKNISELDDATAAAVTSVESVELTDKNGESLGIVRKVKLVDKRAALADVAKHLGMLTDRIDISGKLDLATAIEEGRKRVASS